MLIELLLNALYNIFSVLTLPINLPSFPSNAMDYLDSFFSYLAMGAGIVANYTPFSYLMVLFGIVIAIDAGLMLYKFIMWILKKIPMLGIS